MALAGVILNSEAMIVPSSTAQATVRNKDFVGSRNFDLTLVSNSKRTVHIFLAFVSMDGQEKIALFLLVAASVLIRAGFVIEEFLFNLNPMSVKTTDTKLAVMAKVFA